MDILNTIPDLAGTRVALLAVMASILAAVISATAAFVTAKVNGRAARLNAIAAERRAHRREVLKDLEASTREVLSHMLTRAFRTPLANRLENPFGKDERPLNPYTIKLDGRISHSLKYIKHWDHKAFHVYERIPQGDLSEEADALRKFILWGSVKYRYQLLEDLESFYFDVPCWWWLRWPARFLRQLHHDFIFFAEVDSQLPKLLKRQAERSLKSPDKGE